MKNKLRILFFDQALGWIEEDYEEENNPKSSLTDNNSLDPDTGATNVTESK